MSKKKDKTSKKKVKKVVETVQEVASQPPKRQMELPPLPEALAKINARHFWLVFGFAAIVMLVLAANSGVNGDDSFQVDYSEKLIDYYSTMGQDTTALYVEAGKMHYYGGFFEILAGGANSLLGFEVNDPAYHTLRHLLIALFGLLTILFASLTARQFTGWHGAIVALLLLFLSPRFLGHSLMNPKDIPFACGYMMSLYFASRWLQEIPKVSTKTLLGLTAGIMVAVSTRVGGLLVIGVFGLFALLSMLLKWRSTEGNAKGKLLLSYLKFGAIPVVGGLLLSLLFWPFALVDPINHLQEALEEFSKLGVEISVLFNGANPMSGDVPRTYLFQWMAMTFPIYSLLGLVGLIATYIYLSKRFPGVRLHMLLFAAVFPLFYIVAKQSTLHDGWRHLNFIYPPLIVCISLFWTVALEYLFRQQKNLRIAGFVILGLLLLEPASFIARNTAYPYVYFNPVFGGVQGAFGQYELDYWGVSCKQAVEWLEDNGKIPIEGDTIMIITNFYFNVDKYIRKKYEGRVKVDYLRYNQRFDKEWDYGIFVNRFLDGSHLQNGTWPTERSIHTIDVNNTPICAIYEKGSDDVFAARRSEKAGDFRTARSLYQNEVASHPLNELAWLGLANSSLSMGDFQTAEAAAQKAIDINPKYASAMYYKGMIAYYKGDKQTAITLFSQTIDWDDRFYLAYFFLGTIYKEREDYTTAFEYAKRVVEINKGFSQGYILLAEIYEATGNASQASTMRNTAASLQR
jgi:tetratricopeptide (TPR) repeat protein